MKVPNAIYTQDFMVNVYNRIGINDGNVIDPLIDDIQIAAHDEGFEIRFELILGDKTYTL